MMREGVELEFESDPPPLTVYPPPGLEPSKTQLPMIREKVLALWSEGWVREVPFPSFLFFSRLFLVPKGEDWRMIIDLSSLNLLLKHLPFKMSTAPRVGAAILGPMWGATLDLENAYHNIPVRLWCQSYLGFQLEISPGVLKNFVFTVLPFGLSQAPFLFNRIMKPIKIHLGLQGVWNSGYLDDFLFLDRSPEGLTRKLDYVRFLLGSLGLPINMSKSVLIPSQKVSYLGVMFHLDTLHFSLPEEKVLRIRAMVSKMLTFRVSTRRKLEELTGFLNFAADFLHLGRLRFRPLILWLNQNTSPLSRDRKIPLDSTFKGLLGVWLSKELLCSQTPMKPPQPVLFLMTDASDEGWGGVLLPVTLGGAWSNSTLDLLNSGQLSINALELMAVLFVAERLVHQLRGKVVQLLTDSTTVVSCVFHQGSCVPELMALTIRLLEFCSGHEIILVPKHLSGKLNRLADLESRLSPVASEWTLNYETFQWIWDNFGPFAIDLFATRWSAQLRRFISPCPDPRAEEVNALSVNWNRWDRIYLFPPVAVLPEVVDHLQPFRGQGVLIAPLYPQAPWFPHLLERDPDPVPLPASHFLWQETSRGVVRHECPELWRLHVWRL